LFKLSITVFFFTTQCPSPPWNLSRLPVVRPLLYFLPHNAPFRLFPLVTPKPPRGLFAQLLCDYLENPPVWSENSSFPFSQSRFFNLVRLSCCFFSSVLLKPLQGPRLCLSIGPLFLSPFSFSFLGPPFKNLALLFVVSSTRLIRTSLFPA